MVIIGAEQSLSNSALYKHRCLENTKIKQLAVKCDDKYQYKEILEDTMVSTTEVFTDNSPIPSGTYVPEKKLMQGNHSVHFQKHWTLNQRLPYAGCVMLNQRAKG